MYDAIVVGAGPAGLSAAIQIARSGFKVALLEKGKIGGLMLNAQRIENYLGFPAGISGSELAKVFARQLRRHKIKVFFQQACEIAKKRLFHVETNEQTLKSRAVIVATGTVPKAAGLKGEKSIIGKRIFYEVYGVPCINNKKTFVVIGSGDVAFDYALSLRQKNYTVVIVSRSKKPKCIRLLKKRAEAAGIRHYCGIKVLDVKLKGKMLHLICKKGLKRKDLIANYALIAVGRVPTAPKLRMPQTKANKLQGLYFAGDVVNGVYRQVSIAAGSGLLAAMHAIDYLGKKNAIGP